MTAAHHVTNAEFLQVCFGQDWQSAYVVGFDGDPGAPPSPTVWSGNRWDRYHKPERLAGQNAYFTVSTFKEDLNGKVHRRNDLHIATHVIVIDDIGTKVPETMLPPGMPEPTYKLETSPGNYHWGYVLETPCTDKGQVNALISGMVARFGGKDPGFAGVARVMRLPEGVNGKADYRDKDGKPFRCRLDVWEPSRKVKLEDLAAVFGVTLPAPGTRGVNPQRNSRTPSPAECAADEIYGLLDRLGMLTGGVTNDGGFKTVCPWTADHTAAKDDGEGAYYLRGKYKCHHGHCESRSWREVWAWANDTLLTESGGLVGLTDKEGLWDLPLVPGYKEPGAKQPVIAPPPGRSTGTGRGTAGTRVPPAVARTETDFFDDLIFITSEDRFYSLSSNNLLSRAAVDMDWSRDLTKGLPVTNPRTGEVLSPSRWFATPDNRPRARMADGLTYWPGEPRWFADDKGVRLANKWVPGERIGLTVTDADVEPWLRLVRHIVGGEGPDAVEHVLDWMALVVGAPGLKPGWHPLFQGGQGLGKDLMLKPVKVGVGERNVGSVNAAALGSAFNAWAELRLVVVNELHQTSRGSATGADQYGVLKELTENTSKFLRINQKNQREYYARNISAFAVTSNDEQAVALEADDRRFLVVMALAAKWAKPEYVKLAKWLEDEGGADLCAAWLWDRWDVIVQDTDRRDGLLGPAPVTAGKRRMIANTEEPWLTWMREQIETGAWRDLMTSDDINAAFSAAARGGTGGFRFAPTMHKWGAALRRLGGAKVYNENQVRLKPDVRARVWAVREPGRFDGMSEPAIAQAYAGGTGHGFAEVGDGGADVISLAERQAKVASPPAGTNGVCETATTSEM